MFKPLLIVSAALTFAALTFASSVPSLSAAHAGDADCYTLASVRGTYAIIGEYGAHVAVALGLRQFDGNGNMTGTFTINEPTAGSPTGARTIVTGTQVGTYTINCDGTGVITRTVTASNGTIAHQMDDLLITGAVIKRGELLATALSDAQRVPSAIVAGGIFLTRAYTRLPDQNDKDKDDR
jgi:hypothetical protein